jgi:phenylalanyl-tRNA synthetase alpha chain
MYTVPKFESFADRKKVEEAAQDAITAFNAELSATKSEKQLRELKDRWKGRKNGLLTQMNDSWLRAAPSGMKPFIGAQVNRVRFAVERGVDQLVVAFDVGIATSGRKGKLPIIDDEVKALRDQAVGAKLATERLDISLPGVQRPIGVKHPVLRVMDEIVAVFKAMGYSVGEGPEVETDYYNFESLNFPPNHPARDTQDTIFIAGQDGKPARDRLLLRTHTSPVQIRTMEKLAPPVRIVIPGKVHRNDPLDATHSPVFHQVEGLAVDTNITFCDLKGTLDHAMKALFGSSVKTRFYPSFFPFTEPSADMQVSCIFCGGKGCRKCKFSGWIELLGCGMVDPNVFEFVKHNGYDSSKISGFAFGMGVERIAILKYEVEEIQLFYEGDVRFLEQFA